MIFRGQEDLGASQFASFWLEGQFGADSGVGSSTNTNNQTTGLTPAAGLAWNRRSTVALGGPWGELRLGRDAAAHFYDRYETDPFIAIGAGATQAFVGSLGGPTSVRVSNAISYFLPRGLGGVFGQLQHYLARTRTPLTLILGPVEAAMAQPEGSLSGEDLQAVHRSGIRLLRLVNSLLDVTRIEAGRLQLSFEPTDLSRLTTELASAFDSLVERAQLNLVVNCPPLPEPVYVDRSQWEKIVLNLISNAFKFTFKGEIAVSLNWREDHAELCVRDTGTGISAQELPHIFERFYRVPQARGRSFEGTGIGLALVQELVKLHGGSVRATSIEGQGTTFVVAIPGGTAHLPADQIVRGHELIAPAAKASSYVLEAAQWLPRDDAKQPPVGHPAEHQPAPASPEGSTPAESGRILVVDDNVDMREYLSRLLRPFWEVEAVGDGQAAFGP